MATIATSAFANNVIQAIENKTGKIPGKYLVWGGLGLLGVSVALHAMNRKQYGRIIGQLASPVLMMGLYNKASHRQPENGVAHHPSPRKRAYGKGL
jgi:hypothetical protein